MQVSYRVIGLVAVSLLAGCSTFTEREVDYQAGAVKARPLEVPPNLTSPETDSRYAIPGKEGEKVASYSEFTKLQTEQPCVTPAGVPAATPPAPVPGAKLLENKGVKSIQLDEPFDRSWRRVGLALDHAKLVTSDKDRSKGIYFLVAADKDKKKQPDYHLIVRETATGCEVTVVDQSGKSDADTTRLVEIVYQNLDKNSNGGSARPPRGDAVRSSR